jgi:hypothetical protein
MESKRYITKQMILQNLDNLDYVKELYNSKSLMQDYWSLKFYENFNKKFRRYNQLRNKLLKDVGENSTKSQATSNYYFKGLKYISNIYVNLLKDCKWVDIYLTIEVLELNIPNEVKKNLEESKDFCLTEIEKYLSSK